MPLSHAVVHKEHPLPLSPEKAENYFTCDACKVRGKPGKDIYIYQCRKDGCKYTMHELCGKTEDNESAVHIQHRHKLERLVEKPCYNPKAYCIVCRFPIEGMRYWCSNSGCRVMVHPLCSRLMPAQLTEYVPRIPKSTGKQLFHSIHDPSHGPLTLNQAEEDFTCKACEVKKKDKKSIYECAVCDFRMHERCAMLGETAKFERHPQHELKRILEKPKDPKLSCKKCTQPVEGMRYACPNKNDVCSSVVVHPLCLEIK